MATGYYDGSRPSVNEGRYEALEYFRVCIVENHPLKPMRGALATIMGLEALKSLEERRVVDLDLSTL